MKWNMMIKYIKWLIYISIKWTNNLKFQFVGFSELRLVFAQIYPTYLHIYIQAHILVSTNLILHIHHLKVETLNRYLRQISQNNILDLCCTWMGMSTYTSMDIGMGYD